MHLSRRRFISTALGLGAAGLSTGYAFGWEPRALEVSRREVRVSANGVVSSPIRLLHLSDFHASPVVSLGFIAHAIELGLALQPDVICVTGDFITRRAGTPDPARYIETLRRLADAAPTLACLGNHDGGSWTYHYGGYATSDDVRRLLREAGIRCLHNEATTLEVRGRALQFVGLGDLWCGECATEAVFPDLARPAGVGAARIVLSHNPDSKRELAPYDWDLALCGHTHGGQVRLPILGTPFAPVVDKNYVEGLHRWNDRWLHISRGVGNLHGVRINCPPEITLLTLT